jgi:putative lipoic acid-binding regulatory protein
MTVLNAAEIAAGGGMTADQLVDYRPALGSTLATFDASLVLPWFYGDSRPVFTLDALLASLNGVFRRSSIGRYLASTALITPAAANSPRVPVVSGVRQGLLIEAASENKMVQATGASQITAGGNTNVTVTASPVMGPDGAFSMQRTTSTVASGYAQSSNITLPGDNSIWSFSAMIPKAVASNAVKIEVVCVGGSAFTDNVLFDQFTGVITSSVGTITGVIDLGAYWLVYIVHNINTNTTAQVRHYPVFGGTGSCDIVYVQAEKRPWPTSRIKTVGAALRRERDFISFPTTKLIGAAQGTLAITAKPPGGAIDRVIAQFDEGTENNRITIRRSSAGNIEVVWVSGGVTLGTSSLGAHTALAETTVTIGWQAGSLKAVRDGGDPVTIAATAPTVTTLRLGGNSVDASLDGVISRVSTWNTYRAEAFYAAPAVSLVAWGDSMAAGSGVSTVPEHWIDMLGVDLGRTIYNGGVGGETSTQVKTRHLADTTHLSWVSLYFLGHNAPNAVTTVADLQAMIAHQNVDDRNKPFLIDLPVQNTTNAVGSAGFLEILATRAAIIAAFPNNYVDIPAALAAAGDGSANDNADIAAGYTPRSLLADTIHLNLAGQTVVKNANKAAIIARGY